MNLILDQGNSVCKIAVYDGGNTLMSTSVALLSEDILEEVFLRYSDIAWSIYSSVGRDDAEALSVLKKHCPTTLRLEASTAVPIAVAYDRSTLGGDRLAAVVGAYVLGGGAGASLVIDAGTAITYEYLSEEGEYVGGNIAPGLWLRFKALNSFTSKLPLIEDLPTAPLAPIGRDTKTAMLAGCVEGICRELVGYVEEFRAKHHKARVFLTGGDGKYLLERTRIEGVELVPDLVMLGLNEILEYNKKNRI